jgi:Flp pilus assembly protein TadD
VSLIQRPGAGALVTGLAALALIGGWLMWQPLRSAQAMADAENHPGTAFASARTAASRDPLSIDPLYLLSALYQGNHQSGPARAELVKATQLQPENPQPWQWLGEFDFAAGHLQPAIGELQRAVSLDQATSVDTITARVHITQAAMLLAQRRAAAAEAQSARAHRHHRHGR